MSFALGRYPRSLAGLIVLAAAVPPVVFLSAKPWFPIGNVMSLPVHTLLEFVTVQVCFSVTVVGWATYRNVRWNDAILLSITLFVTGWLDLGHTLSFSGMPPFVTPSSPDKAIYFWLAARFVCAAGFLAVGARLPIRLHTTRARNLLAAGALVVTVAAYAWLFSFPDWLPAMYEDLSGVTPLKQALELTASALFTGAGILLLRRARREPEAGFATMAAGSFVLAMAELFFVYYRHLHGFSNFVGHVYKAFGYLLVYRAVYVACVSKPYRDARAAAEAANDANEAKSRFLANVSHEFRTPLGVIRGFSDMLAKQTELNDQTRKWARTISRNARQLNLLIDDLLDLAKAESDHVDFNLDVFAPAAAVDEVVSSLRLLAERKGVTITVRSGLPAGYVLRSDPLRFDQILLNVIGNAVKFTNVGEVRVALTATAEGVAISVEDSGIGIDPEDAERLFKPFAQANDPLRRHFGGTGLGLALSKKLSSLLKGDLNLEWSAPGRGSRFVVTIADQAEAESIARPAGAAPARVVHEDLAGMRILVAEDSEDNRELLDIYLRPTGARVTFAHDGRAAVRAAQDASFDVILMDIQMPEMDGFEAVSALRERGWTGPIVALTAHAHPPERARARQVGFDAYLVKPVVRETLIKTIAAQRTN